MTENKSWRSSRALAMSGKELRGMLKNNDKNFTYIYWEFSSIDSKSFSVLRDKSLSPAIRSGKMSLQIMKLSSALNFTITACRIFLITGESAYGMK